MSVSQLLRRQWEGYPRYHRSPLNLLLHIVVVPIFLVGNVALVVAFIQRSWLIGVAAIFAMVLSLALQGGGHRQEPVPAEPFTSPMSALLRIFLEQWVTFPRFVFSGGWWRAVREPSAP